MRYKGYHFTEGLFNSTTFNGIRVYVYADEKNGRYGFIELGKTYNNLGLTYNQPSEDVLTHLIRTSVDKFENMEITPEKAVYRYTIDFITGVESILDTTDNN